MRECLMDAVYQGITEEERRVMRQVAKKIAHNISRELMQNVEKI